MKCLLFMFQLILLSLTYQEAYGRQDDIATLSRWLNNTLHHNAFEIGVPTSTEVSFELFERSSGCFKTLQIFIESLQADLWWSKQILNTWGHKPAGLLSPYGSNGDLGHFNACLSFNFKAPDGNKIPTKHVIVNVFSEESKRFLWGICLPSNCDWNETWSLSSSFAKEFGFTFQYLVRVTSNESFVLRWNSWQVGSIIVLVVTVGLTVLGTLLDVITPSHDFKVLMAFSLSRNAASLLSLREAGRFSCLDGIKFIALLQVISRHCFKIIRPVVLYNQWKWQDFYLNSAYLAAQQSVDAFLMITGVLLSYSFLQARKKGTQFNLLEYYLRRYFRLLPAMLMINALHRAIIPVIPSLAEIPIPVFQYSELLGGGLGPFWYIKTDIYLYILSPLILFPLHRFGYKMFPPVIFLAISSISYNYYLEVYTEQLSCSFNYYTRAAPWLLGLLLGYMIFKEGSIKLQFKPYLINGIMGLFAVGLLWARGPEEYETPEGWIHTRISSNILLFGFMFLLLFGYFPQISKALSGSALQFMGKLNFSAYLVHATLIIVSMIQYTTQFNVNAFHMMQLVLSIIVMSFLLAVPMLLLVEYPMMNLQKLMFSLECVRKDKDTTKYKQIQQP